MSVNFQELRGQLTDDMIESILSQYNVDPVAETPDSIIFPTCCHNLTGGSPKLYYYKNSKLFHCFTECNSTFDIFTLLQKMHALRGEDISIFDAIKLCDLDILNSKNLSLDEVIQDNIKYLQILNNVQLTNNKDGFRIYDKKSLRRFNFDYVGLTPWMNEGISVDALQKFNIKYDNYRDAIVIPNFDYDGNLIGIRERFLKEKDILKGKYRPMYDSGILYNHPTGRTFYGIYENHAAVERKHLAIIVEAEKSVLQYGTIYGLDNNVALATLGQNITFDHIKTLLKMKVHNVILAYDTDYEDYEQLAEVRRKYREKAKLLAPYFNVSIIIDNDFILPYKSSPTDGGKEIFEKLLAEREII